MFEPLSQPIGAFDREEILEQLESLVASGDASPLGRISSLANASALLGWYLDRINWVGFYLVDTETADVAPHLVLGPFQGAPACVSIPYGRGVCGTAWKEKRTLVVPDVHAFEGHIACDSASRSEVVVPMLVDGTVVGVLDVDSPEPDRFSPADVEFLEKAAKIASGIYPPTLT